VVTHTINRNDLNALGAIALEAKKIWVDTFTVLVDKGYHNGRKLPNASNNITTIVAHPYARKQRKCHQPDYLVAKHTTQCRNDTYTCPQGETLKPREDGIKSAVI
jgi:hypothetical protein